MIYTSGSTGVPKGVAVPHAGVVNLLGWMQAGHGLGAGDRVLQKTPVSFDVSVWELFWPLLEGAGLVLARPGGQQDPRYLSGLIGRAGMTTVHFVPSMLEAFVSEAVAAGVREPAAGDLRRGGAAGFAGGAVRRAVRCGPCITCTGRRRRRWTRPAGCATGGDGAPADRGADREHPGVRAGFVAVPGAGRGGRGAVRGGGGAGPGLPGAGGADRGAVRGVPVRRAGGADVPDRGPGPVAAGRAAGVRRAGR